MHKDYEKYKKYKQKYLDLKRIISDNTAEYVFKYYDILGQQISYINDNIERISELFSHCFPHNLNQSLEKYDELLSEYWKNVNTIIMQQAKKNQWYFVLQNSNIIGFCNVGEERVYRVDKELQKELGSYKATDIPKDVYQKIIKSNETIYPVINGLCKDMNFKNVGSFLLNKVLEHLKGKGGFDYVYIIPESVYYKINALAFSDEALDCEFTDKVKYREANEKLIEYYKSVGFKESDHLFFIDDCADDNALNSQFILYAVMIK